MADKQTNRNQILATRIAENLFTNGQGKEANRLVLELSDGSNGGGWCKRAVVDQIVRILDSGGTP